MTDSEALRVRPWDSLQPWEQRQILWRRFLGQAIDYFVSRGWPWTEETYEMTQDEFNFNYERDSR